MIDLHSHLMPGADNGAADGGQARTALETLAAAGIRAAATRPTFRGSITTDRRGSLGGSMRWMRPGHG